MVDDIYPIRRSIDDHIDDFEAVGVLKVDKSRRIPAN